MKTLTNKPITLELTPREIKLIHSALSLPPVFFDMTDDETKELKALEDSFKELDELSDEK